MLALNSWINIGWSTCTQDLIDFWWTYSAGRSNDTWSFVRATNFELLILYVLVKSIVFELPVFFKSIWLRYVIESFETSDRHWGHIRIIHHFILSQTILNLWGFVSYDFIAPCSIRHISLKLWCHRFILIYFWNLIAILNWRSKFLLILNYFIFHELNLALIYLAWRLWHLLYVLHICKLVCCRAIVVI